MMNVGRGVPQDRVAGALQAVLAPVVFDQAILVVGSVVLDDNAGLLVEQVDACNEIALQTAWAYLNARSREAALDQDHP
jgi:hypothetical protein